MIKNIFQNRDELCLGAKISAIFAAILALSGCEEPRSTAKLSQKLSGSFSDYYGYEIVGGAADTPENQDYRRYVDQHRKQNLLYYVDYCVQNTHRDAPEVYPDQSELADFIRSDQMSKDAQHHPHDNFSGATAAMKCILRGFKAIDENRHDDFVATERRMFEKTNSNVTGDTFFKTVSERERQDYATALKQLNVELRYLAIYAQHALKAAQKEDQASAARLRRWQELMGGLQVSGAFNSISDLGIIANPMTGTVETVGQAKRRIEQEALARAKAQEYATRSDDNSNHQTSGTDKGSSSSAGSLALSQSCPYTQHVVYLMLKHIPGRIDPPENPDECVTKEDVEEAAQESRDYAEKQRQKRKQEAERKRQIAREAQTQQCVAKAERSEAEARSKGITDETCYFRVCNCAQAWNDIDPCPPTKGDLCQ